MSYDLEVWSIRPFSPSVLDLNEEGTVSAGNWTVAGKGWQIAIWASDRILEEDIPEVAAPVLPGIEYLTRISLEGSATSSARSKLNALAKRLAKTFHGVVFDPQLDAVTTPTGIARLNAEKRTEIFSILELSWWFTGGSLVSMDGLDQFLRCLELLLPEALPRRYGLWEPPQHIYAESGRGHLLQFLHENSGKGVVWYPHRPIASVSLNRPEPLGAGRRGFRSNRLTIAVELDALQQPGWNTQMHRIWMALSRIIRPFYGDVRVLHGFRRGGAGSYGIGRETEQHPVKSWWWHGVPRDIGNAIVLGEVYRATWPALESAGTDLDGLLILASADWSKKTDIAQRLGGVPTEIAQPENNPTDGIAALNAPFIGPDSYPPKWPFGNPFIKDIVR